MDIDNSSNINTITGQDDTVSQPVRQSANVQQTTITTADSGKLAAARPPFPAVFVIAVLGIARIPPADLRTSLGGVIINFWTFLLTELIPDVVFVYLLSLLLLFLLCICRQFIDEFIAHARRLCLFLRLTPKLTDFGITSHDISLRSPLSPFILRVCPDAVLKKGLIKTIANTVSLITHSQYTVGNFGKIYLFMAKAVLLLSI